MLWCFRILTLTSLKGEGDTELPKTPLLCGVADGGGVHQYQSHPGGWGWLTKISWTLLSLRWGKTTVYNIRQMISNTIQKQERKNLSTWNWQFKYVQNRVFTEVPPKKCEHDSLQPRCAQRRLHHYPEQELSLCSSSPTTNLTTGGRMFNPVLKTGVSTGMDIDSRDSPNHMGNQVFPIQKQMFKGNLSESRGEPWVLHIIMYCSHS